MEKEFKIIKDHTNHKKGSTVLLTPELEEIFLHLGLIAEAKKESKKKETK